jgi:uncharacterized protein YyaL (SSP411 family)
LGIPHVDRHIYARENGLAITGLAALYAASGDETCLAEARRAADWIIEHRAVPGGGFRHDEKDAAGPYLADTLAMARAFLALYTVTAERSWLARTEAAARYIDEAFRGPVGFVTAAAKSSVLPPKPQVDENIAIVRFANLLYQHTGKRAYKTAAEHAMKCIASPAMVDRQGYGVSGILLADCELRSEPAHVTIVGSKDNSAARTLFAAALCGANLFTRLEWFDSSEGPLPRMEIEYPALPDPAAFLCVNGACSKPIRAAGELAERLQRLQ